MTTGKGNRSTAVTHGRVGRKNPQKPTQFSPRSHPRHLVGKRTAQKDAIKTITSDSQDTYAMALNKYMHPRNPYKTKKPNFKDLAIKYPHFRDKVTQNLSGKVILDFKDPEALRALTLALLKNDFDLDVSLPVDRLIPTVPQRLNYILWLEDIFEKSKDLKGIDIGAGASCIYPLLGCKQNGWTFLASEVDDQNLVFAKKNIEKNSLQDKITVKKVEEETLLIGLAEEDMTYDFCMCNPPFYSDHLEAQGITTSRSDDRPEPQSISTASEVESISWGGEVKFVTRMIEESLVLKNRIRVYTSLLGKKMNLSLLKDELQRKKITRYSSTEFCQGRTMRWGLAWTFDDTVKFPKSAFKSLKSVKPPITYTISRDNPVLSDYTVPAFTKFMKDSFDDLKIKYNIIHSGKFYTAMNLQAKENTWSHQRRKRRQKQLEETISSLALTDETCTTTLESDCKNENSADESSEMTTGESRPELGDKDIAPVKDTDMSVSKGENDLSAVKMETEVAVDDIDGQSQKTLDSNYNNNSTSVKVTTIAPDKRSTFTGDIQSETIANTGNGHGCKRKLETMCKDSLVPSKKTKIAGVNVNHSGIAEEEKLRTDLRNEGNNMEGKNKHAAEACLDVKDEPKTGDVQTEKNDVIDTVVPVQNLEENKLQEVATDTSMEASIDKLSSEAEVCSKTEKGAELNVEEKISFDNYLSDVKSHMPAGLESIQYNEGLCSIDKLSSPERLSRKEVLEQFHQEQEKNLEIAHANKDQTKKTKYHNFDENEQCLVLFKVVLRKEEGIITLTMEHKVGNKEAMHQIMQYFKNKFSVLSPQK